MSPSLDPDAPEAHVYHVAFWMDVCQQRSARERAYDCRRLRAVLASIGQLTPGRGGMELPLHVWETQAKEE